MRGKRVQRHIGNHTHLRKRALYGPDGALHKTVSVVGLAPVCRLLGRGHDGKQRQRRQAERQRLFGVREQTVDREALDAGHGLDRLGGVATLDYEHRLNQVIRSKAGFAHEPATEGITTHAPQTRAGELTTCCRAH